MNKQQYLWHQQEKHRDYENINASFYQLKMFGGFFCEPIILGEIFFRRLQDINPSDKNMQTARNLQKVFTILCQYNFINGKVYHNENGFSVSPLVWRKHLIGRQALETSIKHLKSMGLIDYRNGCYYGNHERRKRFYTISLCGLEYLLHQAEIINETEKAQDLQLYADFLDYTQRKDFATEQQEEIAFQEYKRHRKNNTIKTPKRKQILLPKFNPTEDLEVIV